jgi:plasmid stabilization system protein ParE
MLAIDEGLQMLLDMPLIGPPVAGQPGMRQLIVPFGRSAYVLRYRVEADTLVVVRVWHAREDRP